jgi:rSAM/selenodomain-associated transferase 2
MIAVIIPTLNEAELLPETLNCVRANDAACEMLVVDGGSTDGTIKLAEAGGARVIQSPTRQRAVQMNLGAQQARSDIFLFLHADTWMGPTALRQIEKALNQPGVVGGGFARRFQGPSPVLRVTCRIGEYRSRLFGWFFGDQGIFARRSAFERAGGFPEWPLFEDIDFCRRLARFGALTTLRPPVVSSSRRFDVRGSVLTTISDVWLTMRYLCGADPVKLASERRTENRQSTGQGNR